MKRYPAFLTKTKPGASMTSGIVNRPSSSVVSLVRFGPSPDWKTSAPATPLPSASTTRPATDRSRDGRRRVTSGSSTAGAFAQSECAGSIPAALTSARYSSARGTSPCVWNVPSGPVRMSSPLPWP